MNREIKFRAFIKDTKEMVKVSAIQFDVNSPRPEPCIMDEHNDIHNINDVILIQYTGLLDKNGKEIYEDDILKHRNGIGKVWFRCNVASSVVDGEQGNYGLDRDCEVIGNIYENAGMWALIRTAERRGK